MPFNVKVRTLADRDSMTVLMRIFIYGLRPVSKDSVGTPENIPDSLENFFRVQPARVDHGVRWVVWTNERELFVYEASFHEIMLLWENPLAFEECPEESIAVGNH